jgi:nicotinamide-nucleotide amidase
VIDAATLERAAELLQALRARGWMLATAESCTGGLIAAALTHVAGSSDVVDRGFVTYSNEAKAELLGVPTNLIASDGAVSEAVAERMAEGAVARSRAAVAVSVTGVAGPGGGSAAKPVGLVWFGTALRDGPTLTDHRVFPGDRAAVRAQAVAHAFTLIGSRLQVS